MNISTQWLHRSRSRLGIGLISLSLLGGCGAFSTSSATSSEAPIASAPIAVTPADQPWLISPQGLGPIHFGMTLEALRKVLKPGMTLTPQRNFWVDWDAMAITDQQKPLFYILYPAGTTPTDSSTVNLIVVADPQYKTAEGIGSQMSIADGAKVYGSPTLSYNLDDEMREYVRFAHAPSYLSFRTTGVPDHWVGRYHGSADGSFHETQDFDPAGKIQFVLLDGALKTGTPSPGTSQDTTTENQSQGNGKATIAPNPDASHSSTQTASTAPTSQNLDCSNPVTTLEINACSQKAHDEADRTLNSVYQQVRGTLNDRASSQLTQAEQTWINFRDAHCNQYSATFLGGTAYPSFLLGCLTRTTQKRIGYLRQELGVLPQGDRTYANIGQVTVDGHPIDCNQPQGTPEENYCAQVSYKQSDEELNQVYQSLNGSLSPAARNSLKQAELAWLAYRDRHCEFATREAVGGTGYEAYRSNCLEDLTRDRTEELKLQLDH